MANFLEERLSVAVKYGASYGDDYEVEITETSNGAEYRRLLHPFPKRRFRFAWIVPSDTVYAGIVNLYHRAFGRYAGFRVRCLDDFSTNAETGTVTPTDQTLAYVSSGLYQLQKAYGAGGTPLAIGRPVRTLFKPVAGTVRVAVNGVESAFFTVDTTTGRITFTSGHIPLITDVVTGGCQFDIPARFDSALDVAINYPNDRDIAGVELIELLNP